MASSKNVLMGALALLVSTVGFAQTDFGWDWRDSSKVAVKKQPQRNEFINNVFPYPPQPRSQWELGFGLGVATMSADVASKAGFGGSISVRKALNHTFSLRASIADLNSSGEPNTYQLTQNRVPFKTKTRQLGIDVIASLNPLSYYRANPKTNVYVLAGYSLSGSRVMYKTAQAGAQAGGYRIFYGAGLPDSEEGLLTTGLGATINNRQSYAIYNSISAGGGISFKLSDVISIGLEQRFTFSASGYDYLDAVKAGNSNDYLGQTSARININIGDRSRKVAPLWWLNPNNYLYQEINAPKHMKLPKVKLPDVDNDGVTDQFDLEPNTPAGVAVDAHGRAKDTDGDGVPDYKDKELITLQSCFPVNNDGVGTCPEPACCKEVKEMVSNLKTNSGSLCEIGELSTIVFDKNKAKLSKEATETLAAVAAKINANPNCNIRVSGYGYTSKSAQQLSWDRVNTVVKYLTEKQGVSESRFIYNAGAVGNELIVTLFGTTEAGTGATSAPHPNLKK